MTFAYNEYLEALHLEPMREMYRCMHNPPYYFVPEKQTMGAIRTLHYFKSKLKPHLLQLIQTGLKNPNKKPEAILDEYVKRYGSRGALPRMINKFVQPEKPLEQRLWWLHDWEYMFGFTFASPKDFVYAYFLYYVASPPEPIQKFFGGHRLNNVFTANNFIDHFKNKVP